MQNPVFFKSKYGNQYFFDSFKNKVHYCKDGLRDVIESNIENSLLVKKINSNSSNYNIVLFESLKSNGYFRNDKRIINDFAINCHHVQDALENINQITFETTEKCNLRCKYCSYSDLYNDFAKRKNQNMPFETAKTTIDYFNIFWENISSKSYNSLLYISFYGGEPLINFEFIQKVVKYLRSLKIKRQLQFSITTNALLINKYIDFLVENEFNILISIDGNETHNSYRLLPNGKKSFKQLYNNIVSIKEKHPSFYKQRVNFNTVIHNKNNVTDVHDFLLSNFGKTPNMSEIRNTGINPKQKDEFESIFQSVNRSLLESNNKERIINNNFIKLSLVESLSLFLHKYGGCNYSDYSNIRERKQIIHKMPSGTCVPFSKRLYITANGLLLPCENVDHKYHLGKIKCGKVRIDFEKIASFYKNAFSKMREKCDNCYISEACSMCMYNMETDNNGGFVCNSYVGHKQFQEYLSLQISKLEEMPNLYKKILKTVSID